MALLEDGSNSCATEDEVEEDVPPRKKQKLEVDELSQFLKGNCSEMKFSEVILDLCTNSTTNTIFPNMSTLAKICRVIPIHTADVKRTFSQLKLIKTSIRNRMQEQTLDSLLRIAIEGPPLNSFPVAKTVALWASKKQRRLYH